MVWSKDDTARMRGIDRRVRTEDGALPPPPALLAVFREPDVLTPLVQQGFLRLWQVSPQRAKAYVLGIVGESRDVIAQAFDVRRDYVDRLIADARLYLLGCTLAENSDDTSVKSRIALVKRTMLESERLSAGRLLDAVIEGMIPAMLGLHHEPCRTGDDNRPAGWLRRSVENTALLLRDFIADPNLD